MAQEEKEKAILLSVNELQEARAENPELLLIDVRTPEEYKEGHIAGALNIDFLGADFKDKIQALNQEQALYIYCRSGNRSQKAAAVLSGLGFQTIYDLKGGYLNWEEKRED